MDGEAGSGRVYDIVTACSNNICLSQRDTSVTQDEMDEDTYPREYNKKEPR